MVKRYVNVSDYVGPELFANGMEKGLEIVLDLAGKELTFLRASHVALCFYL